jgi:protein-S-isoprenylcysteine O-methyltransferase Ste14
VDVAVLELVGMAVIVGPPIVQTVAGHLGYALVAIGFALALSGWGVVTRVRRRALMGSASVVVTVLVLVVVPLAREVPTWRGPALWLSLIGLGVVAILIAAFFEQGRAVVRRLRAVLAETTEDWEHTGGPEAHHGASVDHL